MNRKNNAASPGRFIVLEVSVELIDALVDVVSKIRKKDASLAKQIRDAASSVALNLGEGRRREGGSRTYHYTVAAGSADEVRCALRVAVAWGYVKLEDAAVSMELIDRINAMLYRLTH